MDSMKLSKNLRNIAERLDNDIEENAGERIGFTLIIYTENRASYISTVNRADSIREMKFLLECWEKGMEDIPAHEVS